MESKQSNVTAIVKPCHVKLDRSEVDGREARVSRPHVQICHVCSAFLPSQAALKTHFSVHPEEKPFTCKYQCGKTFHHSYPCKEHELVVHENKLYKCGRCDKSFRSVSAKQKHGKTHTEPDFFCQLCPKFFHHRPELEYHIRAHTGEKPFTCKYCAARFTSQHRASVHEKSIHQNQNLKFNCRFCDKIFSQLGNRNVHEKYEHKGIRFTCNYCSKHFPTRHLQFRHELTHTGEKNYVCGFCSKAFARQDKLTDHTKIHTGEKPYKCDQCHGDFLTSNELTAHKVRKGEHNGEYKSRRSRGKNYHQKTHSRN